MQKLNCIIFFLFLLISIPVTSFAFKPSPSYVYTCQSNQKRLTYIFHESVKSYNSETNSHLDSESPSLNIQEAIKFLKEYGYTDESLYKVSSNCILDIKYYKDGLKEFSNHKNVFYCKFHGSEVCGIKSSYPNELSKEYGEYNRKRELSIMLHSCSDLILFGLIVVIGVIVTYFVSHKKKKKKN